jgi:hypothetical protein
MELAKLGRLVAMVFNHQALAFQMALNVSQACGDLVGREVQVFPPKRFYTIRELMN